MIELRAAAQGLLEWGVKLTPHSVKEIKVDSTVALSYLTRMKGGRKKHLRKPLMKVHKLLRKKHIEVIAEWIPTEENKIADYWSRVMVNKTDYMLNPAILRMACRKMKMRMPAVDLFAQEHNKLAPQWNSRFKEMGNHMTDTLRTSATDYKQSDLLWMHPPFRILPEVARWLVKQKAQGLGDVLMVTPFQPQRAWHVLLESIAKQVLVVDGVKGTFLNSLDGESKNKPDYDLLFWQF